jgi:hypothetical protein
MTLNKVITILTKRKSFVASRIEERRKLSFPINFEAEEYEALDEAIRVITLVRGETEDTKNAKVSNEIFTAIWQMFEITITEREPLPEDIEELNRMLMFLNNFSKTGRSRQHHEAAILGNFVNNELDKRKRVKPTVST